ncbi:MAG: O-antigen ligase family protein, partial [Candidatus Moraniibacteriota bacterium]
CCIAASIALLPIAHLKLTVFGAPLYSVEIPILIALAAYAYGWRQKTLSPFSRISFRNPFVIGITLFFSGAMLSFFANPFSLTGLGMLKTWFVFPLVASWLWLETDPETRDLARMLAVWLGVMAVGACVSLFFFFQGALTYDGRLAAWYASPNYLAFFLAPGVLLAGHFLSSPSRANRNFQKPLLWLSLTALIFAIFLTRSYEMWVGILAGLSVFLLLDTAFSWRKKIAVVLLCLGIFSILVFCESGSGKWQSLATLGERSSLASREMIWRSAVRIIADHPLFGIGIGRFQETYLAYQRYFPPYLEWAVPQPHNLYLAVWLQAGLMGLIGFFLLMVAWFWKMRMLLKFGDEDSKKISVFLIATLAMYGIAGLVDTTFFKTDLAFVFWLLVAFGIGLLNKQEKP